MHWLMTVRIGVGITLFALPFLVGFGPGGVIAGSLAAVWQASIGNVATGSLFAMLQSLAMTGFFKSIGILLATLGGVF